MNEESIREYLKTNSFEPTVNNLRDSATRLGITGAKKMSKAELINAHSDYYSKWKSGDAKVPNPSTSGAIGTNGARGPSSWNLHCKNWAKEKGVSIAQATKDRECKAAHYKAQYEALNAPPS